MNLYKAMAVSLAKRGVIDDENVTLATEEDLKTMSVGLGCPEDLVALQLGGM
jgi:hypothetical protein